MVEINNLSKSYGINKIFENESITLTNSCIYALVGVNGIGKSTFLNSIIQPSTLDKGSVKIDDIPSTDFTAKYHYAFVPDTKDMFLNLTGKEYLQFVSELYNQKEKFDELLAIYIPKLKLENSLEQTISSYSLGMKQRLGIAQALLHNPKLIILDEPTNGLDVNGIIEMRRLLKNLAHKGGVAIMVSSHILAEMEMLCDEIAIIVNGKIQQVKTLDEIKESQQSRLIYYIQVNYPNYAAKLLKMQFHVDAKIKNDVKDRIFFNCDKNIIPKIISYLVNKKMLVSGAGKLDISLEDEFIEIVKQNTTDTSIS